MSNSIFWFTNDLRISDNLALSQAIAKEKNISFVYCCDPQWRKKGQFLCRTIGDKRYRFLYESLTDIDHQLRQVQQHLNVFEQDSVSLIERLHSDHEVNRVYHSHPVGFNESSALQLLKKRLPKVDFIGAHTFTLYTENQLPFSVEDFPDTFSNFRRKIERRPMPIAELAASPESLGTPFIEPGDWQLLFKDVLNNDAASIFKGGECAGLKHAERYFAGEYAQSYKATRNALDDFEASTKFSPWLALGCISPRQVMSMLKRHEAHFSANESTYWICFELLWREYFQWYSRKHQQRLFSFGGIRQKKPLTSFYDERYQRWCQGTTAYPIVNACMKQLNATGYMSNRGRQLVASCFVNELGLDWRYGAAYFEEHLVDYDVASNWGNWQYLAGVGADPRGIRRFNLEKQTGTYDPKGEFIDKWGGREQCLSHDSLDAAGWPIMPGEH